MRAYCPAVLAALAISGGSCAVGRGAAVGGASARVRAPLLAPRPLTMLGEPEPKPGAGGGARRAQGARTSSADEYAGSNSDSEGDRRALLAADDPSACPRSWRDAALLPALLGVYVHNQWSRSLLFYLVDFGARESGGSGARATRELMNVELGFGPETYGVLASLPFTLVFAPASLLAGTAADRLDRARLTWVSLLCWSAATLWQGAAQSVGEVAASRALQGLAQAVTTPAAFTLIADVTPAARRGTANSIFASGVYVGGGLAALSILLDEALGWRGTLYAAAALGALLAAGAALTLDDPREREPQGSAARTEAPADAASASVEGDAFRGARTLMAEQIASLGRTAAAVSQRPAVQLLLFSCALRFCAGFSIAVWVGPWGRGAFPEHEADFALAKASISAFGGGFSAIAGGALSDKLGERDAARRLWLPIAGSVGAAVCWSAMLDAQSFDVAMRWLLLQYLCAECWFGAAVATLQAQLPKEVQGGAQGAFSTLTVVGNVAPLLIGQASRSAPLADVLHQAVPAMYVGSAIAFALTCRQLGRPPRPEAE